MPQSGEMRRELESPQGEELPHQRQPLAMRGLRAFRPAKLRGLEGRSGIRVGDPCDRGPVGESCEALKLAPPPGRDRRRQLGTEVAKEQEWRRCGELLAHEQHRHERREQEAGISGHEEAGVREAVDPAAERAVADHVMVLKKAHERTRRQLRARRTARFTAKRGVLALIGEALGQCAPQAGERVRGIVGVVTVALAAQQHVQGVMHVVVPLGGSVQRPPARIAREVVGFVPVVLQNEVYLPVPARPLAQRLGELANDIRPARVAKGVHGIEPQPVEAILLRPVERVVHEIISHRAARGSIEVDRGAPGRALRRIEELRAIHMQIVAVRTEVVVHDIEQDHQPQGMRAIDEGFQLVRCTVAGRGRERQHAVVPPVARARKCRKRHELQCGNAERGQLGQPGGGRGEGALRGERADVQFVHDGIRPGTSAPHGLAPGVRARIDDAARFVHAIRIAARGGIGHRPGRAVLEVQQKFVARAGACLGHRDLVPAGLGGAHRAGSRARCGGCLRLEELELGASDARRPHAKARAAPREELRAERHVVG
jgi:hypothetical protein